MNQNKIIVFLILIFSGIMFILFSLLVRITGGKNTSLVSKKVKIGMHIVMLTSLLSVVGCQGCKSPPPMCYDVASENIFEFSQRDDEFRIIVELEQGRILRGRLLRSFSDTFTFEILDETKNVRVKGNIRSVDGKIDSMDEEILIDLPETLSPGIYYLTIYEVTGEEIGIEGRESKIYTDTLNVQ